MAIASQPIEPGSPSREEVDTGRVVAAALGGTIRFLILQVVVWLMVMGLVIVPQTLGYLPEAVANVMGVVVFVGSEISLLVIVTRYSSAYLRTQNVLPISELQVE